MIAELAVHPYSHSCLFIHCQRNVYMQSTYNSNLCLTCRDFFELIFLMRWTHLLGLKVCFHSEFSPQVAEIELPILIETSQNPFHDCDRLLVLADDIKTREVFSLIFMTCFGHRGYQTHQMSLMSRVILRFNFTTDL